MNCKKNFHFSSLIQLTTLFFVLVFPFFLSAKKDTIIYFGSNGKTEGYEKAIIKKDIRNYSKNKSSILTYQLVDKKWSLLMTEKYCQINDSVTEIKMSSEDFSGKIKRVFDKEANSLFHFTDYLKGKPKRTGFTGLKFPLLLEKEVTEFYENGKTKSVSVYEKNELVSNTNWLENGEEYIGNVFYSVDQQPLFEPGINVLHKHILQIFKESGIDITAVEGRLIVGFTVMEDGQIDGIQIVEGLGTRLNNLAMQAFFSLQGKWKPAVLNNKSVRYFQLFPINFIYRKYDIDFLEMKGSMLHWHII